MKKIIALALAVLMIFTCFVGCKGKTNDDLANAVAYLENMYPDATKDEPQVLSVDKDVLSVVTVDGVAYNVEWAVVVTEGASDAVKIAESETENCVKIDIPDMTEEDILFTATATVKDDKDNSATAEFSFKVKGIEIADDAADVETILNDAYALEEGKKMESEVTLTGIIKSIDTPYDASYKNVTVTIVMQGFDDKPIKCRLAGEGADTLAVGDTITVTGIIANYKGTIEFEQGCVVKEIVKGDGTSTDTPSTQTPSTQTPSTQTPSTQTPSTQTPSTPTSLKLVTDQAKILKDAFALGRNETTPYIAQLEGKVISIDKDYNDQYGSICVTITVGSKKIKCWNMKGDGVKNIKVGDTITVVGVIKNYYYDDADTTGDVEFTWDEASQTEVKMIKRIEGKDENKKLTVVDNPVPGKAYKFGMIQANKSATDVYYLAGGMDGYYMASTSGSSAAIDVYLEATTGGYYLYTNFSGSKQYINMVTSADGQHVNGAYESTAKTVYTYDATSKTIVANATAKGETKPYWFGTRNDKSYTTIGPCATEYEGFYCKFYQ